MFISTRERKGSVLFPSLSYTRGYEKGLPAPDDVRDGPEIKRLFNIMDIKDEKHG